MQLAGRRMRLGSPTGLYDVRFGEDMHVLIGCGLGGGSLINAGVALRPDPRVFADPVWPAEVAGDGLLDEGYARAARWVRPARDDAAAERTKYQALASCRRGARQGAGARPCRGELRGNGQSGRRRAARLHALRGLLRRLQRRRQEYRGAHLPARCGPAWRRDLHPRQGAPRRQGARRRLARRIRAAGRRRRRRRGKHRHGDGRHGGAGGRHARLDRDPAALARAGARPLRSARQKLLGQRRHHRLRLRRQGARQCHRRRPSEQGRGPGRRRLRLGPDRDRRRGRPRATA